MELIFTQNAPFSVRNEINTYVILMTPVVLLRPRRGGVQSRRAVPRMAAPC